MVTDINIKDAFPEERDLENHLRDNPEKLEEGMTFLKQQYNFKSGTGRADLLYLDREGQLVVVEVKIVTAWRDSVMQLLGYLYELDKDRQALFQEYQHKKKYSHMVHQRPRGIIVAPQIAPEVRNALEFIKENTIELRRVRPVLVTNLGEIDLLLDDVLTPDSIFTQNPTPTEGGVVKNTNNTALQKISEEIIMFTRALGAPGEIITSVSPKKIVFKCSASGNRTKKVFLRLHVQITQLKLEYKIDASTQLKLGTENIISANGWDEDIQTKIKDAHLLAQS